VDVEEAGRVRRRVDGLRRARGDAGRERAVRLLAHGHALAVRGAERVVAQPFE
jgi:hypothetical protein